MILIRNYRGRNFNRHFRLSISFDRVIDLTEFLRSLVSKFEVRSSREARRDPSFIGQLGL